MCKIYVIVYIRTVSNIVCLYLRKIFMHVQTGQLTCWYRQVSSKTTYPFYNWNRFPNTNGLFCNPRSKILINPRKMSWRQSVYMSSVCGSVHVGADLIFVINAYRLCVQRWLSTFAFLRRSSITYLQKTVMSAQEIFAILGTCYSSSVFDLLNTICVPEISNMKLAFRVRLVKQYNS